MKLTISYLRDFKVPKGTMATWWLGQAGFIIKTPGNIIIAMDPYLSNSCKKSSKELGLDLNRLIAPPLFPEELVGIDLYAFSHSHQDHLDPETVIPYSKAGGCGPYVGPPEVIEKLESLGIPKEQTIMLWPNKSHTVGDLTVRATFAIPFGGDDLTHIGYLISSEGGPTFYFTCDTDYHEILANSVVVHKPDVMFTVINGVFRNLGPAQAALLAKQLDPKLIIPYHYDMFPDVVLSPNLLKANLVMYGMQDRLKVLENGEPFIFPSK